MPVKVVKAEIVQVPRYGGRMEFNGNVANEPVRAYAGTGLAISEVTVALDAPKARKGVEQTTYMKTVCFGDLADYVAEKVGVGDTLAGYGRLRIDKVKKEGKTFLYPKLIISELYHKPKGEKVVMAIKLDDGDDDSGDVAG